jgi:hypothetical protein
MSHYFMFIHQLRGMLERGETSRYECHEESCMKTLDMLVTRFCVQK